MAVRKSPGGKWICEIYPQGREGKRIRKLFATKGEALSYERQLKLYSVDVDSSYAESNAQSLVTLVNRWYDMHGRSLADGEGRLRKLEQLCESLGDPVDSEFTKADFAEYRKQRLSGKFGRFTKPVKESTINREHSYLNAVFNELKHLGEWEGDNPLDGLRQFKESENELAFLYQDDIEHLLSVYDQSSNQDLGNVVGICLATGARWSEAEGLKQSQVVPHRITYINTKGKRNRTIPISKTLYNRLPKKRGVLFSSSYDSFRRALRQADIELPEGQLTHVLRYTFASHFMMNGGNILVLKEILGHTSIQMTMRYAHFAPDHLDAAVQLNPNDRLR
ncbi:MULTISPECIES: phage integrase [unclassified Serratia (in: enterobacteria)]|uniref:phage integrase n=1 Tax=unclassified Serratia (in: enterobacteria) TaxID=2647522 RepID=UPI0030761A0E